MRIIQFNISMVQKFQMSVLNGIPQHLREELCVRNTFLEHGIAGMIRRPIPFVHNYFFISEIPVKSGIFFDL